MEEIIFYVQKMAMEAQETYHVNPWLFIIFMTVSTPVYYFGYYLIGKSLLKVEKRKIKRKRVDKHMLKMGIGVTVFGWYFPYVYVMIFGKLPLWLWVVLLTWIFVLGISLIRTLKVKTKKIKNKTKLSD